MDLGFLSPVIRFSNSSFGQTQRNRNLLPGLTWPLNIVQDGSSYNARVIVTARDIDLVESIRTNENDNHKPTVSHLAQFEVVLQKRKKLHRNSQNQVQ